MSRLAQSWPCIALRLCTCPEDYPDNMYDKNCIACRVWAAKINKRMREPLWKS